MEKQTSAVVLKSNTSLTELPLLHFSSAGNTLLNNPPQPKKAWTRRIASKKVIFSSQQVQPASPQHQDLTVLDTIMGQAEARGKPAKRQPLIQKQLKGNVAARQQLREDMELATSRESKQWEFRMPGIALPTTTGATGGDVSGTAATNGDSSDGKQASVPQQQFFPKAGLLVRDVRLPKPPAVVRFHRVSPEPSMYLLERKQSHGSFVFKPNLLPSKMAGPGLPLAKGGAMKQRSHLAPVLSPSFHHPDDLQVEGSAVTGPGNGIEDETVMAAQALGALEVSVGKERRLKEELARNHKTVLKSFRGVVAAFFAAVHSPSGPKKSLALAKCSVVVHTLVSTIQMYLRWRQSYHYLALLKQGHSLLASRIALSAPLPLALDPSMLGTALSPSPLTNESLAASTTPFSTDTASMHDHVLDSMTIAHLKQLYFDYYDCECFVLPGMRDDDDEEIGSDVQLLDMECRSVHSVIEERNVLLASRDGELPYDDVEEEAGCIGAEGQAEGGQQHQFAGSMVFDETVERERIFGADHDSSEDESLSATP